MFELKHIDQNNRSQRAEVLRFLEDNPNDNVRVRPDLEMERSFRSGLGLAIYANSDATKNRLSGCSLIHSFDEGSGNDTSLEIGTMLVTSNGFGIQRFIACFHLFQEFLESDRRPRLTFAVVSPSSASEHILKSQVGMKVDLPSDSLMALRSAAGIPFAKNKIVLFSTDEVFESAVRFLRKCHVKHNIFACPKGEAQILVRVPWFESKLLEI